MKKVLLTLALSVFAVSLSLASGTTVSIENEASYTEYEVLKDSCDKDCKKKCCSDESATTKKKKACTKGKKCCKGKKATASADNTVDAKPAKKACCKKGKGKCAKGETKAKPAEPQPTN